MTSPLDNGNRWAVLGVAVFMAGVVSLIADRAPALALVNESPSLPKGLYLRRPGAPPERGAIVAINQPPATRAYLASLGMPGEVVLIKRVTATGGDRVCRVGDRVVAGGRTLIALRRDRTGVALPVWSDCRTLAADELFLAGDTASSFDSRYFGPVRRAAVVGVFAEGVTW
jgi:conjugative transfer signal peptidase TraF